MRLPFAAALVLSVAVLGAGCDSDSGTGGPQYPSMTGNWDGQFSFTVNQLSISCPTVLDIDSQNEGNWSGDLRFDNSGVCETVVDEPVNGTVNTASEVTMRLLASDFLDECVQVSGSQVLEGQVSGGVLILEANWNCDGDAEALGFNGTR